jgi:hypothetical protein
MARSSRPERVRGGGAGEARGAALCVLGLGCALGLGHALAGCGASGTRAASSPPGAAAAAPAPPAVAPPELSPEPSQAPLFAATGDCHRKHPGVGPARLGELRQSGAVALVTLGAPTSGGRRVLAYVADGDEPVVHTVDVTTGRPLGATTAPSRCSSPASGPRPRSSIVASWEHPRSPWRSRRAPTTPRCW